VLLACLGKFTLCLPDNTLDRTTCVVANGPIWIEYRSSDMWLPRMPGTLVATCGFVACQTWFLVDQYLGRYLGAMYCFAWYVYTRSCIHFSTVPRFSLVGPHTGHEMSCNWNKPLLRTHTPFRFSVNTLTHIQALLQPAQCIATAARLLGALNLDFCIQI
jgi:hypothetical protein